MPISRIFGIFASVGSFLGLVQPICAFCTFYHILLFYLSHAYRCFLCYALLQWLFICFCVDITLCVSTRLFLWMLVWLLTAYNINYKDP